MYKSKYFVIQEYVPPSVYADRGEKAWEILDPRLLKMDDAVRNHFGVVIINTWHSTRLISAYKYRSQSGLRTREFYDLSEDYYKSYSAHKYGMASDKLLPNCELSMEEVRRYIEKHPDEFPDIKGIERKVSWLHTDVRNRDDVLFFNP